MGPKRAPARCAVALKPGDVVSAATYSWGRVFAKEHGDNGGRNDDIRIDGKVVEASGQQWICDFGDEQNIAWKRGRIFNTLYVDSTRAALQLLWGRLCVKMPSLDQI